MARTPVGGAARPSWDSRCAARPRHTRPTSGIGGQAPSGAVRPPRSPFKARNSAESAAVENLDAQWRQHLSAMLGCPPNIRPARRPRRPARCRTSGRCSKLGHRRRSGASSRRKRWSLGDVGRHRDSAASSWLRFSVPAMRGEALLRLRRSSGDRYPPRLGHRQRVRCCAPLSLNSKCRCGPVAQPVEPTAPIRSACSMRWPLRTSMRLRWA